MGISGLARWIDQHAADACDLAPLDSGARVLIDGCGLAYFVLKEVGARAQASDYGALDCAFTAVLDNLCAAGLAPEVYLDGPATRLKTETLKGRASERMRRLEPVQLACLDRAAVKPDQLPDPSLMVEQLAFCTTNAGVPLFRCEGEADPDMARACLEAERAGRGGSCYVLADDSDFFFFPAVRYVRFADLMLVAGGASVRPCEPRASPAESPRALGRAWTRAMLGEVSGLPDARLSDWAVLCGNDATSGYKLASFGARVAESLGADGMSSARPLPEDARAWLADAPEDLVPGWLEALAEPSLARALRFSRALYDLDDEVLASFPLDHSESRAEPLEILPPPSGRDVSSVGKAALAELAAGGVGRVIARLDGRQDGPIELLPRQEFALKKLLRGERANKKKGSSAPTDATVLPRTLAWEDVELAWRYQGLCRLLLRSGAMPPEPPSKLFDGPSFYAFCLAYRPPAAPPALAPIQAMARGKSAKRTAREPVDSAAYGSDPAAAAARKCMHCGAGGEGEADVAAGRWYCYSCWDEWNGVNVGGVNGGLQGPPPEQAAAARPRLPVDDYAEQILERIGAHRVSLIAGETGCGKSSRVPELLLRAQPGAKIMVAQPRRIAAHALFERSRAGAEGHLYGLRMGHGVRDEGAATRCWYVTTGYLVRLAGRGTKNRAISELSYIIIDECHERATDADLLCLLARRLLATHPRLRIVLMSATLHARLLLNYFSSALGAGAVADPLFVGVRRFPLAELFLEEVLEGLGDALPARLRKIGAKLDKEAGDSITGGRGAPSNRVSAGVVQSMVELVPWVVRHAAAIADAAREAGPGGSRTGAAVLIFVAGMAEIEELAEHLQTVAHYNFVPIHSQLPFESQLEAFDSSPPGITKVIVATNAAESSLTLPDVDAVIDLGTHKLLTYSASLKSAVLQREWVSKASAQQRAGRTARVRPGRVYRLYPRRVWEAFADHEAAQVCREPLEASVLRLRTVIDEGQPISALMREMIEPPDDSHVAGALRKLFQMGMLELEPAAGAAEYAEMAPYGLVDAADVNRGLMAEMARLGIVPRPASPDSQAAQAEDPSGVWDAEARALDTARLTPMGRLASALPLEPQLSRLVALGIRLGCAAEAVVIAAACAQPRSPFRIVSPLIYTNPNEYNELVRGGFHGRLFFDRGMYSEPLCYVALVNEIEALNRESARALATPGAAEAAAEAADTPVAAPDDEANGTPRPRRGRRSEGAPQTPVPAAAAQADEDSMGRGTLKMTPRVTRFCTKHGLAPKQVRQLLVTLASLRQSVKEATGLQAADLTLPPDAAFPPPGRAGSLRLSLLRLLLVWSCPEVVVTAEARPGRRVGAAPSGPADMVRFSSELSDETLRLLLPPPTQWAVERRCSVVVHLCHVWAEAEPAEALAAARRAVQQTLLVAQGLDWVFLHTPDARVLIWARLGALERKRDELARCLCVGEAALLEQLRATPPHTPEGYALLAHTCGPAQLAELKHFSSRRGVALDDKVAVLRVTQPPGDGPLSGSLVTSNAPPLCDPPSGPLAALTPAALELLRDLFGAGVLAKVSPGQAPPAQLLRFGAQDDRVSAGAALQPPLVCDRPAGVRLLCSMAAGYRDGKLRVCADEAAAAGAGPAGGASSGGAAATKAAVVVGMDAAAGLDWKWNSEGKSRKVLLDRHTVLKAALPALEGPFYAVGTSVLLLGDGGSLAAVEGATLLPPGSEWLSLVLAAGGCKPLEAAGVPLGGALLEGQLAEARRLALLLRDAAVAPQPALVERLRALLEPWLTQRDGALAPGPAAAEDPDAACPICYAVLHESALQLPKLLCATCRKGFHAACLYRWFAAAQRQRPTADNFCPHCQCAV